MEEVRYNEEAKVYRATVCCNVVVVGPYLTTTDFLPLLGAEALREEPFVSTPWMMEIETSQGAFWAIQRAVQRPRSMVSLVTGLIRPRLV